MYDYDKNITVTTTPNGDKVITMSKAIYTNLCNSVFDAQRYQLNKSLTNTAKDTLELWRALSAEEEE